MANEEASEELDLGEEKSGKSKLIIIIAIVAVLLIGGGLAAFFLLGGEEEATDEAVAEEPVEEEKGPAQYLDFKPPFVVNMPGRPSLLQIGVSIRVYSEPMAEFIRHNDPMIRHHLLDLLSTKDGKSLKTREAKEALQAEMLEALNKVVKELEGPGEVDGVFFTSFVMQ
ncbi:MAG: flagellar basal body-associated FliL family protein [Candidatus Thiodiazotropha sp. (ex. Lucinisca nassula)]|nr:flagellar basal body-associated FliL family protein [Candidatus Thiodiazotropha sp. (ex. Lucinisca nassula)]MBW9260588.1 flagellar basal body-associated FliL family protein [Candidatus Thiodiazotropha sp. (ex. Lucinisca nassula)]MBW9270249.1 flagellar basal body-associated FliL family protein [Candidatus Thiodiazotropha sp. (ex. Lucinisca nassula)]